MESGETREWGVVMRSGGAVEPWSRGAVEPWSGGSDQVSLNVVCVCVQGANV